MLTIQDVSYVHPNKDVLFSDINLSVSTGDKIALTGANGTGKSTLLKLIAGFLEPSAGVVKTSTVPYFIPQLVGQFNDFTIAEALEIDRKLKALNDILSGNSSDANYEILNDDWTIEERCNKALQAWNLNNCHLSQKMSTLSGGQKTKVFLAGISIHEPDLVLLDEPSNHLDTASRQLLYTFIKTCKQTLITVSHDRSLLNLFDTVCELSSSGITVYGGNYDFYAEQKQIAVNALSQDIHSKEKSLKIAREKEKETLERQQKLNSRGKGKQEKSGVARIMMNTLRNNAENSTARLKGVHAERISDLRHELQELRSGHTTNDLMKLEFDKSVLHQGKKLFIAENINLVCLNGDFLWKENLNLEVISGERVAISGSNGSGKTSLIKIILGNMIPQAGTVFIAKSKSVYIDQDYSLIDNKLTVYEQAQQFNTSSFQEHDIKMRLNRFLFTKDYWDKPCEALSGGERMRLVLCCLNISNQSPDIIVLDEPTNNLDIQNIEILTDAINGYEGTLLVISHDDAFLKEINIQKTINLG